MNRGLLLINLDLRLVGIFQICEVEMKQTMSLERVQVEVELTLLIEKTIQLENELSSILNEKEM